MVPVATPYGARNQSGKRVPTMDFKRRMGHFIHKECFDVIDTEGSTVDR